MGAHVSEEPTGPKAYQLVDAQPLAIVVYCSDPRFQNAFRKFISEELGLHDGEYLPLVVSGGVASLSEPLRLPKEFKFMKERIELFLERFSSITRIILINHEDCRHYEALRALLGNILLHRVGHISEKQKNDLRSVAKTVLRLLRPDLEIELYYAKITGADKHSVEFEQLSMT